MNMWGRNELLQLLDIGTTRGIILCFYQISDANNCGYWRAGKCRVGIATVDSYVPTTFTIIKNSSLNENKFEQNVLMDYLRKKKLQMQVVAREMIDAMEVNQWNILLSIL